VSNAPLDISISPADLAKFRRLTKELSRIGGGSALRKELRTALRKVALPANQRAKVAARALPAKGKAQTTGLRRSIARNVRTSIRATGQPSVKVYVSKAGLGNKAALPRLTNLGKWRHPVWGMDVWVDQESSAGWFDNTMRDCSPLIRAEIINVSKWLEGRLSGNV
jgi:hypothetical protein